MIKKRLHRGYAYGVLLCAERGVLSVRNANIVTDITDLADLSENC